MGARIYIHICSGRSYVGLLVLYPVSECSQPGGLLVYAYADYSGYVDLGQLVTLVCNSQSRSKGKDQNSEDPEETIC